MRERDAPIIVKGDGLAVEKGVVIVHTVNEACATLDEILVQSWFGAARRRRGAYARRAAVFLRRVRRHCREPLRVRAGPRGRL